MKTVVLLGCCILLIAWLGVGSAQEIVPSSDAEEIDSFEIVDTPRRYWNENLPEVDRTVELLIANTIRKGSFLFIVDHRNRQPVREDTFDDFLGFDAGGLKIGIGLRYGLGDRLDAGIYRLNGTVENYDVYDFDFRIQVMDEQSNFADVSIRPGITWFSQKDEEDATGGFLQILISRTFKDRLLLGAGLLYHSDSSNDVKHATDDDYSTAIQAQMDIRVFPRFSWVLETSVNVAGYGAAHPRVTTALKILTHRHTFAILATNSQYISSDGVTANTNRGFNDLLLGFSITRELGP